MNTEIFSHLGIPIDLGQDLILLILISLVSFVFGMFVGKRRLITVLINIYVSFAILAVVPKGYFETYTTSLIFFYALVILLTVFGNRFFEIIISGSGSGFLWRIFSISFFEIMLLLSITFSILPKSVALGYISKTAYGYLTAPNFQFFWMIAPLVLLLFVHKRLSR